MPIDLQEVSDRLEIADLLYRYAEALETRDWDLLATCFTAGAEVDYSASGGVKGDVAQATAFLAQTIPLFSATHFLIANPQLQLESDEAASGRTHFRTTMVLGERGHTQYLVAAGYYHDRFARTAEGWRISRRVEEPVLIDTFTPRAVKG
jgi:3-phenylpropionate/cinnamic acid dioxygenase small subunit